MHHAISLFTCDRGITPARAAYAAEQSGFDAFYVPEHTHTPVIRNAPHPATDDGSIPDDRYMRTLDPWVALAMAATVTESIRLGTAVALPVQCDPIGLAKTIATLDHLSGGRVVLGAGFGWNTDELAHHRVPIANRRGMLREYLEAMVTLWTEDEGSYQGEFVRFSPSWAYPKPTQEHIPVIIGAQAGPKTFTWIARNADGWMTTPIDSDIPAKAEALRAAWTEQGRGDRPLISVFATGTPDSQPLAAWDAAGVTEVIWQIPDLPEAGAADFVHSLGDELSLRTPTALSHKP